MEILERSPSIVSFPIFGWPRNTRRFDLQQGVRHFGTNSRANKGDNKKQKNNHENFVCQQRRCSFSLPQFRFGRFSFTKVNEKGKANCLAHFVFLPPFRVPWREKNQIEMESVLSLHIGADAFGELVTHELSICAQRLHFFLRAQERTIFISHSF